MNKLILMGAALVILAGAFPDQASTIIAWSSRTLGDITGMVSPGQQTAIVIVAVLLALVGINSK